MELIDETTDSRKRVKRITSFKAKIEMVIINNNQCKKYGIIDECPKFMKCDRAKECDLLTAQNYRKLFQSMKKCPGYVKTYGLEKEVD